MQPSKASIGVLACLFVGIISLLAGSTGGPYTISVFAIAIFGVSSIGSCVFMVAAFKRHEEGKWVAAVACGMLILPVVLFIVPWIVLFLFAAGGGFLF